MCLFSVLLKVLLIALGLQAKAFKLAFMLLYGVRGTRRNVRARSNNLKFVAKESKGIPRRARPHGADSLQAAKTALRY